MYFGVSERLSENYILVALVYALRNESIRIDCTTHKQRYDSRTILHQCEAVISKTSSFRVADAFMIATFEYMNGFSASNKFDFQKVLTTE